MGKLLKFRHKVFKGLAYYILYPYAKFKYHADIKKFKTKEKYLILYNHQTAFDQFFVGMVFKGPIYYVASEDLFSNGFISKLLRYAVDPIPIKKQTNDLNAVKACMKVAKEGGTIAIAPEGNRTYSGTTEYIKPSIVKMIKALKLPVAFLKIEGGFGAQPRFANDVRRGKMKVYVKNTLTYDEARNLADDELYKLVCDNLYQDDSLLNLNYISKNSANYLERIFYVCPCCGFSTFNSNKDKIKCNKCDYELSYLPNLSFNKDFKNVKDYYDYQANYIINAKLEDKVYFKDVVDLYEVILYKNKKLIKENVNLELGNDFIILDSKNIKFNELDYITILGRNKLNIYYNNLVYQIKGKKEFNALKYIHFYHKYKNEQEGNNNGKFLGL